MRFSERSGLKPLPDSALESISSPQLKNAIWTLIYKIITKYIHYGCTGYGDSTYYKDDAETLWTDFFHKNISKLPYAGDFLKEADNLFQQLQWFEVFDLVEWVLARDDIYKRQTNSNKFNKEFEQYHSPYRIISGLVQPISDKATQGVIEDTIAQSPNEVIKGHLINAQKLYSDRNHPNFKASCHESIQALEANFHLYFKNTATLVDNIKKLKKDNQLNQHLFQIVHNINSFRGNDTAHANKNDGYAVTMKYAILIHLLCCGFINYFKPFK